ncbi:hypothetical protein BTZ20_1368 [Rhodococcus sp. MTM3W5.2]|nr:hypothetical protein BTZ20_1368 [Rhodococcus sp. MTM3W5.2]
MGTIHITAVAKVPVHAGFAYVDDYRNVPAWMFGVTRFEPVGEQTQGLGPPSTPPCSSAPRP